MKKLILIAVLLVASQAHAQKVAEFSVGNLFRGVTEWADSIKTVSSERVVRTSTGRDTLRTNWIDTEGLNGEIVLRFSKNNQAGVDTLQLYMELYRGIGTPDSSGIERNLIATVNSDTTQDYILSDSSWVSDEPFPMYRFTIFERDTCQNDYIINVQNFSPSGSYVGVRRATGANN